MNKDNPHRQTLNNKASKTSNPQKKPYQPPVLQHFGKIVNATRDGGSTVSDSGFSGTQGQST